MSRDQDETDALLADSLRAIQTMAREGATLRSTDETRDRLARARALHEVAIRLTRPDPVPPKGGGGASEGAACPNCGVKLKLERA